MKPANKPPEGSMSIRLMNYLLVLGIGLKNQNRLIGNSRRSIIDYNLFLLAL